VESLPQPEFPLYKKGDTPQSWEHKRPVHNLSQVSVGVGFQDEISVGRWWPVQCSASETTHSVESTEAILKRDLATAECMKCETSKVFRVNVTEVSTWCLWWQVWSVEGLSMGI
jgi:hypothetical protein